MVVAGDSGSIVLSSGADTGGGGGSWGRVLPRILLRWVKIERALFSRI